MHFKLLIAFVEESKTNKVIGVEKKEGATAATVINHAHGEELHPCKTFLGLSLQVQYDIVFLLVEQHLSRSILENICAPGEFEAASERGIAIQIDIEDAVGMLHQIRELEETDIIGD